jgi:hypothetical protein
MEIASSAGARPILSVLASRTVKASVSPAARRLIASARWCSESFRLRPNLTPLAIARLRPSPVRSRMRSRSKSAMAAGFTGFDHRIKLLLSLSCHHSTGGVLGDGLRAQTIALSRILRCSVFRLRRMRLSRPSHSIVCSYAWYGKVL